MDRELLKKTMMTSISEVLEKMFFLPLDFCEAETPAELWEGTASPDLIAVRLTFTGPLSGRFVFLIPRNLAANLTADFMGIEPNEVPPEHVEQTVKEILNMIGGSTFSTLDEEAVFELGIPETLSATDVLASSPGDDEVFLGVDTLESRIGLSLVKA